MEKQLIEEISDGVATLPFNRPDRLNALSTPIMERLARSAAPTGAGMPPSQKLLEDLDGERRSFLKSAFVAGGGAAAWPVLFLYELGALGLPWEPSLFSDEWLYGT
jgi:hypothetical protein